MEYTTNNIQIDQLVGESNSMLYKNLIFYYNNVINSEWDGGGSQNNERIIEYNNYKSWLENELENTKQSQSGNQLKLLNKLVILGDREFYDFSPEQAKKELINIISYLKKNYLVSRMREIEKLIAQSEKEKDINVTKELLEEFKALSDELNSL